MWKQAQKFSFIYIYLYKKNRAYIKKYIVVVLMNIVIPQMFEINDNS